jgi:hypothetical protein
VYLSPKLTSHHPKALLPVSVASREPRARWWVSERGPSERERERRTLMAKRSLRAACTSFFSPCGLRSTPSAVAASFSAAAAHPSMAFACMLARLNCKEETLFETLLNCTGGPRAA